MSGRKKLIFGNWKMNFSVRQSVSYASKLASKTIPEGVSVAIFPNTLALSEISTKLQKTGLKIGAQNAYFQDIGAFTGEIAMPMLRGITQYVLVGHSERRHILGETKDDTRHKVAAAFRAGITPVLCVGETLTERNARQTKVVLNDQLNFGLADLTGEEIAKLVIAYEPVWAIGTGRNALPQDVAKAVKYIRDNIKDLYGEDIAKKVNILYGGSITADSATSLLTVDGVDGLLIGGSSLSVHTFWPIVEAAGKLEKKKIKIKEII